MLGFFRAYKAATDTPTYFIESTAPDNVDDTDVDKQGDLPGLTLVDSDEAVNMIAKALMAHEKPNLVVMVHGFNNPQRAVLNTYKTAAMAIAKDRAITDRKSVVCIGYRWPSESMGQPWRGWLAALPTLPTWILCVSIFLSVLPFLLYYGLPAIHLPPDFDYTIDLHSPVEFHRRLHFPLSIAFSQHLRFDHFVTMVGLFFGGLVLTAALLRLIVYFRDNYRATNYGIPDLVQIIRAIDGEIKKLRHGSVEGNFQVDLSFIGHSMGAFVVTNTIRILSDVFEMPVTALNSYGAGSTSDNKPQMPSGTIGNFFVLKRFLLASPDIPAETLLSGRGNFLASALSRFEEAYLFSNEGDEVLRQISTLANYFTFPTKGRDYGFRLGNVEILSDKFGIVSPSDRGFLNTLRVGNRTLQELDDKLENAKAARQGIRRLTSSEAELPKVFTYFDCTDYFDQDNSGKQRPLLTFAKCKKSKAADARLGRLSHLHLLWAYLVHGQKPNVHGGYFEGVFSQQLIYRLACLGYDETKAAYGGEAALSDACKAKQIRGLLSPHQATGGYRQFLAVPRRRAYQEAVHDNARH